MTRNEALEILDHNWTRLVNPDYTDEELGKAQDMAIESLSIEIVRCKDCKYGEQKDYAPPECRWYCKNSTNYHDGSFFCSLGERREECEEW